MARQSEGTILQEPFRAQAPAKWRSYLRAFARFMRTKPLGAIGVILIVLFVLLAITAPSVSPRDPAEIDAYNILASPTSDHLFGTDMLGRDMLSRTIWGSRVSIFVGLVSMLGASIVGAVLGVTSAYFVGKFDLIVQRFIDALTAFPSLLLAMALVAAFGSSFLNVIAALVIVFTPRITRVVRSVALSIKEMPYVESSRAIGAADLRIMFRHILPNTFASLIIVSSGLIGSAIVIEASLSFLGVGTTNLVSWGGLLSGEVMQFFTAAPWIVLFPGIALTLLVFGVNVLGDALRDVLDPRLRGRN